MHKLQIFRQATRLFLLLSTFSPPGALGNTNRKDYCGISMHTSDMPGIGNFSVIDATWRVPEVATRLDNKSSNISPALRQGIALCCGDDCSARLLAGLLVTAPEPGQHNMAPAMFELSPSFSPFFIPEEHRFYVNSSEVIWTRVEILGPHRAQLTFSKFVNNTSNMTVSVDLGIGTEDGGPVLNVATRGNGVDVQYTQPYRGKDGDKPEFCGDSAWWWLSDSPDTEEDNPGALSRFAPVLVAGHGLQATGGKLFPADLTLSGLARFWNMVRDTARGTELLCITKGFVDTGMTMFYPPHPWGV